MADLKAIMLCHTHWDREWYFTREVFRTKLVRLIDGLLELVETQPEYVSFMLDGQTIVIEDYLEIKPYNRERLMRAIEQGKILCGPWYILPDELLVSGEAHIRNYLQGAKVLPEGAKKMKTAYLPDSFGHPAQMPQIAKGLGMDAMVFWRGTSNEISRTEFYWESPCKGEKILCIHLPNGYGNCGNLSPDMQKTKKRVENLLKSLGERSTVDTVLLMNGSDHIAGQKEIVEIVKKLNLALPEHEIRLGTLEEFIEEVRKKLPPLQTWRGECRSGERSMLLGGTLSSRMELKQKNHRVQKKMERYLEPMQAAEALLGRKADTKGYQEYIWKKILENHPHDSICGCSIDEVHEEMLTRLACVEQLEDTLLSDTVNRLKQEPEREGEQIFLFEPSQDSIASYLETEVCMDRMLVQAVNFTKSVIEDYENQICHPQIPANIRIQDEQGRQIPFVIKEASKSYETLYQDHTMPEIYKVNRLNLGLLLPPFSCGFHTLYVTAEKGEEKKACKRSGKYIENAFYKIGFEGGAFTVLDKQTGRMHRDVAKILDGADAGDEYTYSWPQTDQIFTLEDSKLRIGTEDLGETGERLYAEGILRLPEGLEKGRKKRERKLTENKIRIEASLHPGIPRIDFEVKIHNCARDHRLQIQIPSGIHTEHSEAYHTFGIVSRPVEEKIPEEWLEYPQTTHPNHGFVSLEDGEYGLCVANEGLPEFEAVQKGTETCLNLTLLRCVGWLSRTDLLTRKGNGGWTIETPKAQCLGVYTFRFSIAYHVGSWRKKNWFGVMEKAVYPAWAAPGRAEAKNPLEFLNSLPANVRVSALKKAEDQKGLILRLFSIGTEKEEVVLPMPEKIIAAERVNLAEEFEEVLAVERGILKFSIRPSEILTLRLKLGGIKA